MKAGLLAQGLDEAAVRHKLHQPTAADKKGRDAYEKMKKAIEDEEKAEHREKLEHEKAAPHPSLKKKGKALQRRQTRMDLSVKVDVVDPENSPDSPSRKRKKRKFSRKKTVRNALNLAKIGPDEGALLIAAEENDVDKILDLLDAGTPVDCKTDDGYTPLLLACNFGAAEAAQCLLEHGANINHQANDKTNPLILAAYAGHPEVIDVLFNPANPVSVDKEMQLDNGATAMYMAAQEGHVPCITKLIKAGCDPDQSAKDGVTPLYVAAHEE